MVEIKNALMEQIGRSLEQNDRFVMDILKRIPKNIGSTILGLCADVFSDLEAYSAFLFYCEDGLENFAVKPEMAEDYLGQVERVNEDLHDFIYLSAFQSRDRLTTLVLLYRVYESELEVRSL